MRYVIKQLFWDEHQAPSRDKGSLRAQLLNNMLTDELCRISPYAFA